MFQHNVAFTCTHILSAPHAPQEQLDPIDWATYCPHLWTLEQRYYSRVAVLFGPLTQLQRSHPQDTAATRPTTLTHMNPLNVLPVAPRFQYLPISAPTGLLPTAAAAAAAAAAGGVSKSVIGGGAWAGVRAAPAASGRSSSPSLGAVNLLGE